MLLILLLSILLIWFVQKKSNFEKKTKIILLVGSLFAISLFVVYRFSLSIEGRNVYFSDAETYWKDTIEVLEAGSSDGYNSLYYDVCALLQILSPFTWVGWNNLFNILCVIASVIIVAYSIKEKNKKNQASINLFLYLVLFNPFIWYGLMRNLKDALFLLMSIVSCASAKFYHSSKRRTTKILIIGLNILTAYLFTAIRPWGFIIPLISIMVICAPYIKNLFEKNRARAIVVSSVIAFGLVAILFLVPAIINNIILWAPIVFNSFFERGIIENITGIAKFFLAPGPLRSLFGAKYFEHYLIDGNILASIGELMWWASLIPIVASVLTKQYKKGSLKRPFVISLLLTALTYTVIYIMQYGGSAELRIKGVLYIYLYAIFFQLFNVAPVKQYKKQYIFSSLIMLALYSILTIVGIG